MVRDVDRSKVSAARTWRFEPFVVTKPPVRVADALLEPDEELLIIERGGVERAFVLRQMAYHHIAQGELAGEPYVVSF
jgi:hypothetical protein